MTPWMIGLVAALSPALLLAQVNSIGSRPELFVDDHAVQSMKGVTRMLHEPRKEEIAIEFNAPWEGSGNHYVTVFQDGPLYRMYYRAVPGHNVPASGKGWHNLTCYAESKDGIHWVRPELGLIEFQGSRKNNIILDDNEVSSDFAPFLDANPAAPPNERYKALGGASKGLFGYGSSDGIHWTKLEDRRLIAKGAFDSQNLAFWDSVAGVYRAYFRDFYVDPGRGEHIRGIRTATSHDFRAWSEPESLDYGDAPNEHFYTNAIQPYFHAPQILVGFPMRYLPFRNAVLPKIYDEGRGVGLSDAVFITSRDGIHFERTFTEAFVRPGLDPLNWTDRSNAVACGLVKTGEDEMSIYVLEHFRLPSIRLRRATLRTDGFISIHAPSQPGELITKPFTFSGKGLFVNYSSSAAGSLRVEVLDESGKPVQGYTLRRSGDLFGDSTHQSVTWGGEPDIAGLAGKPIRLRFVMKEVDLYSFRFE